MPWGAKQTARNGVGSSPGMKISAVYGMLSKSIESIPSGIDHHGVLDAVCPPAVYPIKVRIGPTLSTCFVAVRLTVSHPDTFFFFL